MMLIWVKYFSLRVQKEATVGYHLQKEEKEVLFVSICIISIISPSNHPFMIFHSFWIPWERRGVVAVLCPSFSEKRFWVLLVVRKLLPNT